ncbi:MAG: metal ABC transporter substrate-binding protein, partial [Candidatus Thalassarchaeaceae archaeon]
ERDQHYLKDSAGTDIEPIAQEGAGAHDHGDHGDEHSDEMCHNTETHMNYNSTEEDCEAAGHQWMGDDIHGDEHSDEMCYNTETHMNYNSTEEDCEAAGHAWMGHDEHNLPEIHAERAVHTFSFPEEMVCYDINTHTLNMTLTTESDCQAAGFMWTSANSGPSDDDHDDHNETDDHDDHGEEEHHEVGAVVIHIEAEGDYGFALPKDVKFHVLMGEGGHDDHDDHGSEAFEWAGVFAMNDATHTWSMQKVGGDYADPTMRLVLIPTDTATEENMHDLEVGVEALIEGDSCTVVEDGETMSSIATTGSCFELHVGTGDDSTFTIDTTGITGMAMYAQHVPTEFERDQHYLKDSAGTDIEPIAQEGAGAHGHGDHGDGHDDEIEGDQTFTYDPHSWLDPLSFGAQVDVVLEKLILTFPNGTSNFTENANSYKAQLQTLDDNYQAAFGTDGTCAAGGYDKTIVANHNAYSYMSVRYDIDIITVHGLDPEGEPSPQDIIKVINHIKENDITVLFVEEYTNENAVNSIVEDTGVSVEKLYTMEMAPIDSNDNYMSLMNKNLNNLVNGIGC